MEKEFEEYWSKNQKRLILNAPKALRDEYIESTKLDSPIDWVCFILPVALGIGLQPVLNIQSEILSWAVVLLIVVVCFAVLQLVKPMLQKKKSTIQVVKSIKAYYYEVYKKNGLKKLERVCHKSMTHPFSQKTPTCKLLSCSLRKFSVLFTTKPKLSQARALSFCKKVVSLQKTFIEYGKDTNKIRN